MSKNQLIVGKLVRQGNKGGKSNIQMGDATQFKNDLCEEFYKNPAFHVEEMAAAKERVESAKEAKKKASAAKAPA